MRGIAALCVAVGHSFTVMSNGRIEEPHFALRAGNALLAAGEILVQPNTAVVFFYVLSGFVLGEALRRRTSGGLRHLTAFAVRRLWRLLPVMWLSILFAAVVALTVRHAPIEGATAWFRQFLSVAVSPGILVRNFLGLSYSINSVLWSIQIELAMIALLPLMVWLSEHTAARADGLIVALLCAASLFLWGAVPNFVMFAYCFYLGVALPKFLSTPAIADCLGNGFGVLVALVLLVPVEYLYVSNHLWMPYKFLVDTLVSAYVIGFILLRADCTRARFLDHPALVRLGDISYSFYCYAMSVLILVAWALLMIAPQSFAVTDLGANVIVLASLLLCVAISLVLAQISFRRIESPCIAIGRQSSKRLEVGRLQDVRSWSLRPTDPTAPIQHQ